MSMLAGFLVGLGGAVFALTSPVSATNGFIFVVVEIVGLCLVCSQRVN